MMITETIKQNAERLRTLADAGVSVKDMASALGVPVQSLYVWLSDHAVEYGIQMRNHRWTTRQHQFVLEWSRLGVNAAGIRYAWSIAVGGDCPPSSAIVAKLRAIKSGRATR